MPISQADVDAITEAIAAGEKSVTFNGKTVVYRSIDELIRARDVLVRDLQAQGGGDAPMRPRQVRLYHGGRGF